jgi:hypothetical protein
MKARDALAVAWTGLSRRKGRTALTAAGVVVGVAALVFMVSLGLGLKRQVLRLFESEEELRTLQVMRVASDTAQKKSVPFLPLPMTGQGVPLTEKDLDELRRLPGVESVTADLDMLLPFKLQTAAGTRSLPLPVGGADGADERRLRDALVAGRLWTSPDERACLLPKPLLDYRLGAKVEEVLGGAVVFGAAAEEGEPEADALRYTCVGVFDPDRIGIRGRKIMVPHARALELRDRTRGGAFSLVPYRKGTYAAAKVRVADPKASQEVAGRLRHSGYDVLSLSEVVRSLNLVFLVIEGFLLCIGAIGLIVSLFGIANTMAMAVLERTREIGIMKALGARNADIGRLFLTEAAALGALGGAAGLTLGFLGGKLLDAAARRVFDLQQASFFHVPLWLAGSSLLFSIMVSVLAGAIPARRAARMEPVAALRYE